MNRKIAMLIGMIVLASQALMSIAQPNARINPAFEQGSAIVSGRVVDEVGNPVPTLSLSLTPVEIRGTLRLSPIPGMTPFATQTTTDANGQFHFDNVSSGPHQIGISWGPPPHHEPAYQIISMAIGPFMIFPHHLGGAAFMVQQGTKMEGIEITVKRRMCIRGRILYADGTPLTNAHVQFRDERRSFDGRGSGSGSGGKQTDAEGYYEYFADEPGFYTISVEYEGMYANSKELRVEEGDQFDDVDLILDGEPIERHDYPDRVSPPFAPSTPINQWIINPENGHSYKAIRCGDWHNAKEKSAEEEVYLVAINDAAEQEWLLATFGRHQFYWIGLTDEEEEEEWKWTNGEPVEYTNWADIEPNNLWDSGEHYAIMNWMSPGQWNDLGPSSPEWHHVQMAIIEQTAPTAQPDLIAALIESGYFSELEIQQLEALRQPWKFDRTGQEIQLPQDTTERFPSNGDFEDDLNGWTKWFGVDRMDSQRTCEVIYDEDRKSNVVEFKRMGGGADGSLVGVAQDVYIDLSKHNELYLQLDVKSLFHTLDGGGWAGGSEYPVCIELAFVDAEGRPYRWQHGFYHYGHDQYPISTEVVPNEWFTYTSPNLKEITPLGAIEEIRRDLKNWFGVDTPQYETPLQPKAITRVMLFGGGWDYTGRTDNLRFITSLEK